MFRDTVISSDEEEEEEVDQGEKVYESQVTIQLYKAGWFSSRLWAHSG